MNKIGPYTFEEYTEIVKSFHGGIAPGVLIGGFMIDLAYRTLPGGKLYDVISETAKCLPDAVQLLTPCTIGNQWLRIINVGRYALVFYEKQTGAGVRVYIDNSRLDPWPTIREWYLKLKPKHDQNTAVLLQEIKEAGKAVCGIETIRVSLESLVKPKKGPIVLCPLCREAFRSVGGETICPACRGGLLPYVSGMGRPAESIQGPAAGLVKKAAVNRLSPSLPG